MNPPLLDSLLFRLAALDSGPYWEVTWSNNVLLYRRGYVFQKDASRETLCTPDAGRWARFWDDLDRIGVWNWKPDYSDPGVLDGQGWQLEIKHAGRTIQSKGDNGYPGPHDADDPEGPEYSDSSSFGQFMAALRNLTGIKDIR